MAATVSIQDSISHQPYLMALAYLLIIILFPSINSRADTSKENWAKEYGQGSIIPPSNPPVISSGGGPDAFGYYYYDSNEGANNAPRYRWVSISFIGTNLNITEDDQVVGPFHIGFDFSFYGQIYTEYWVCSNGWIGFTGSPPAYLNRPLPTPDEPNNLMAVFWDDLVPDSGIAFRYSNNVDTCIIAWHNFHRYNDIGRYTFEVILTRAGDIIFQYFSIAGTLDSHSIGVENSTGTIGLQYVYDAPRNETGTAIYFGPHPPRYAPHDVFPNIFASPAERGSIGDTLWPAVRFINGGTFGESFWGRVKIVHNGTVYNRTRWISGLRPDSSTLIQFPAFFPSEEGQYQLVANSELTTDQVPRNDTIRMTYSAFSDIYAVDFEADAGSFFGDHDWQWGIPTSGPRSAHSGVKVWGTILNGDYSIGPLLSSLITDTLVLDSAAMMTFWHWYDTEALFDGGNVKISSDDGLNWSILTPQGGYDGFLSDVFYNPIGGEPAFFGISGGWIMETFNLSEYGGQTALIKLDFGSDISSNSSGWYFDDFTVLGARQANPGWIAGDIIDFETGSPLQGALAQAGRRRVATDSLGGYVLEMLPGQYSLSVAALYHNPANIGGVTVIEGDITILDIALTSPELAADTTAIDTFIAEGQTGVFRRNIQNNGSGPLEYNIRIAYGQLGGDKSAPEENPALGKRLSGGLDKSRNFEMPLAFGDELFTFDPQTPTGDDGCVGVEFDGSNFWVTGRHNIDGVHKLHKFDRNGNYLLSFNQNTSTDWGWRDLAFDGAYLYASDENELAVIDRLNGQKIDTLPMPSGIATPLRALAYDPASDHFWAANYSSNIIEFDRLGRTIGSFANDRHIYGLAWDSFSPGGPWLWVFSQDGDPLTQVSQFDPRQGSYTYVGFFAIDHNGGTPDLAAGACFTTDWEAAKGVLFCLVMGRTGLNDSFDLVQGYEIARIPQWLTAEPSTGTLQPSESRDLLITIDFSDSISVIDSTYHAEIVIENNGAITPIIPVISGVRSGIEGGYPEIPRYLELYQNYPNPFNSSTKIRFGVPSAGRARIDVFNILGQRIITLFEGWVLPGYYSVTWNAEDVASGIYYYKISIGQGTRVGRMSLLK